MPTKLPRRYGRGGVVASAAGCDPLICRIGGFAPLDQVADAARKGMSGESRVRYPHVMGPEWFFNHAVRRIAIDTLAGVAPWTAEELERRAMEYETVLQSIRAPSGDWHGPAHDPWLQSWERRDPLLESGLAVMRSDDSGDDIIMQDAELQDAVRTAATSEDELLRRAGSQLATRLGLTTEN